MELGEVRVYPPVLRGTYFHILARDPASLKHSNYVYAALRNGSHGMIIPEQLNSQSLGDFWWFVAQGNRTLP